MNHFEWSWQQDGKKFYAQGWNPARPKGVVCIVHGFNEHSGRYERPALQLCNAGYAVLAYDEFGHGQTEGQRGHAPSYEALLDSIKIVLDEADKRFPSLPKFLWGHSMGGCEVVNYLLKRKPGISGAIATAPLFRLAFAPPAIKVMLANIMVHVYPAFTEKANLEAEAISRDKEEVKKYIADPFNHNRITAGLFFGMYTAGQWALQHASELQTPLLLMHGTADRLTSVDATKEFAAKAPKNFVTLKLWEGFYHELHNEPEPNRTETVAYIINWLNAKL